MNQFTTAPPSIDYPACDSDHPDVRMVYAANSMGMDLNDHRDPIDYQVLGDLLMNFDWNMEKKPKRTRPNKRASKAPMKLNIADKEAGIWIDHVYFPYRVV